jgi:hypothetical protein
MKRTKQIGLATILMVSMLALCACSFFFSDGGDGDAYSDAKSSSSTTMETEP